MFGHVTKLLTAYHHGELSPEDRRGVESHVSQCSRCRRALDEIGFAVRMASSLKTTAAPPISLDGNIRAPQTHRVRWAAVTALVVVGVVLYSFQNGALSAWEVDSANGQVAQLRIGQWVETDEKAEKTVRAEQIGQIRLETNTRLRVLESRPDEHRMELKRGTVHAQVWAPPRLLFVETPSATAIDLGCAYTLSVDDAGDSVLKVTAGLVQLESKDRSSFVPAGWVARTRRKDGPGTPYVVETSNEMQHALDIIDFDPKVAAKAASVDLVLKESRDRDMVTLWHLLSRVDAGPRKRIYDRMLELDTAPEAVTTEGIMNLNAEMMGRWKSRLGLAW